VRDVFQYFDLIEGTLAGSGGEECAITYQPLGHLSGLIDGMVYFFGGSRLEFSEFVYIRIGRPVKEAYRYQYLKERKTVFRYDNSPHHRNLPNFPHHKHVGRKVVGSTEPTLGQVLKEIATILEKELKTQR
jgi:hypothetical protein